MTRGSEAMKARLVRPLLESRYAPAITHASLAALTALLFAVLLVVPFWIALVPGVMIAHRIGILLHEYFHGIPFRRYRHNLAVLTAFDGLLLLFGLLELIRALHLSHHRWLNDDLDPVNETVEGFRWKRLNDSVLLRTTLQNVTYLVRAARGEKPYVKASRIWVGAALSVATVVAWRLAGHPEMVWKILATSGITLLVPVSIRGAIEHFSFRGDANFANEYRVMIPLFNANRHVHHHLQPTVPWYLLEFKTEAPLRRWSYFAHWFRVYVTGDFVLMPPPERKRGGGGD